MALSMNEREIEQVVTLTDNEILAFLKQQWDFQEDEDIVIRGKLSARYHEVKERYDYRIHDIKSNNGTLLEYPISDLEQKHTISSAGIFLPYANNKELKEYVHGGGEILIRCTLVLSVISERKKYNNPVLLNANPKSVQLLDSIKNENIDIIKDEEGNILIAKSIVNYLKESHKKEINNSILLLKNEYIEIEEEIEKKRIDAENDIKKSIDATKEKFESEIIELKNIIDNNKNVISELDKDYESLNSIIKQQTDKHTNLIEEISKLQNEKINEEELMSKKLEKFRSFVKDKADTLLQLGFIDEDEYDYLLTKPKETEETENFLDFKNDFDEDFSTAISHIQAYLSNKNIMYPRYIIEDFFALIKTNDLIILAGESGSGKTNLIKSFADAVGGISKIIPVKPNWTSSEDLLGYYNPLEKKYLSTPFLDTLLDAIKNPDVLYFICLDEMNLARVEYYFADFLSLLEERGEQPEIHLYSDDESGHVLSEFKNVLELIKSAKSIFNKDHLVSYIDILKDEKVNAELKRVFGFRDEDSLIKYHSDLRKMINGVLKTPSSIEFPKNVRIIGAINIDETTHYLSPKILDRAHIMKFDSPLLFDWDAISEEIGDVENKDRKIKFTIDNFGKRMDYPKFERETEFSKNIIEFTNKYFSALGIEVGLRTIRQGLNYIDIFNTLNPNYYLAVNNFFIHKILPKLMFDGYKKVDGEVNKKDKLIEFQLRLEKLFSEEIKSSEGIDSIAELKKIIEKVESNDGIVNYWA